VSARSRTAGAFGSWESPITAALVASHGVRLAEVTTWNDAVCWLEGRPSEGGRIVPVRWQGGATTDLIPAGFNARSRVHEYGGGVYALHGESVYFTSFADGRIYRCESGRLGVSPAPLTPEGPWFYADLQIDPYHRRILAVREDHTVPGQEAVTSLVAIPLDGTSTRSDVSVLVEGYDFYSTPRLDRDGTRLAWLCWRHPLMPWDGTELWVADVAPDGSLRNARRVVGGDDESIYQPGWLHDGTLLCASDRSGWWQLYRVDVTTLEVVPVLDPPPDRSEFGRPEWIFGTRTWVESSPGHLTASYTAGGHWHLGSIDLAARALRPLAEGLEPHEWLAASPTEAYLVASSTSTSAAVVRVRLDDGQVEILRSSSDTRIDPAYLSEPRAIEYATAHGRTSHAFFYPPANKDWSAPPGERPPLIAIGHGGPTTATTVGLDLRIQYWTSRGFAVVDVNYSGSSGYGRDYRRRLAGQWGIVDVEDMIAAARYLVSAGDADPRRLIVRGGSAGGYTTLAALTFHPGAFQAGASYYGICDLEVLARDTHKFEARYMDRLVGPYPETRDEYRRRSPIHAVDRLASALILFQGSEDRVVPPNQSRMMAEAVRRKGLPVAYVEFEGEQHGFRRAATIVSALEAELFFYGRVFGFTPAGASPLHIDNLGEGLRGRAPDDRRARTPDSARPQRGA
jgi:dipeptidyl aminopeptidase/acylaminoacyl peptidase